MDDVGLIAGPVQVGTVDEAIRELERYAPTVVAVDSPKACAPDGQKSRPCERELVASGLCNLRWTPDRSTLDEGNTYYDWVLNGLALYAALADAEPRLGWTVIEVFPTASWTVWAGCRGSRSRAAWTSEGLAALRLADLPDRRLNQDDRDAVAAALTARLHARGQTRSFREIVVPAQ